MANIRDPRAVAAAGLAALLSLPVSPAAQAANCPTPTGLYVTPGSERGVTQLSRGKENGVEYIRIGGERFFVDGRARQMPESTTFYEARCESDSLKVEMNLEGTIRKLVLDHLGQGGDLQVTVSEGDATMKVLYKPYLDYVMPMSHEAKSCPRYNRRFVAQGGDSDGRGLDLASVPATTGMLFTVDKREFKVNGKRHPLGDMHYVADCVDKNIFIRIYDKSDLLYTSLRYAPGANGNIDVTEIDPSFAESRYKLRTDIKEKEQPDVDFSDDEEDE